MRWDRIIFTVSTLMCAACGFALAATGFVPFGGAGLAFLAQAVALLPAMLREARP